MHRTRVTTVTGASDVLPTVQDDLDGEVDVGPHRLAHDLGAVRQGAHGTVGPARPAVVCGGGAFGNNRQSATSSGPLAGAVKHPGHHGGTRGMWDHVPVHGDVLVQGLS